MANGTRTLEVDGVSLELKVVRKRVKNINARLRGTFENLLYQRLVADIRKNPACFLAIIGDRGNDCFYIFIHQNRFIREWLLQCCIEYLSNAGRLLPDVPCFCQVINHTCRSS